MPAETVKKVPFIDLKPLVAEVETRALAQFAEQVRRAEFVEGPAVTRFERLLENELGMPHAVGCSNGTDALVLALRALGVGPGNKVALPDLTFWATYEAIVEVGATPVLIDIDPDDLQMSFDRFAEAHERIGLDAAVLVHLFGWASPRLGEFRKLAANSQMPLIEDAAQAFGVRAANAPLLEGAECATLSFYPAKVIGAPMDAGAVLFRDPAAAERARSLKNHGRATHYSYGEIGYNSRMASMAASYLLEVCAIAPKILENRRRVTAGYRERLRAAGSRLRLYGPPPGIQENGYLSVVASDRDDGPRLVDALGKAGIGCARTYPEPISVQPPAHDALCAGELVESARFCKRVVNLPLYYGIAEGDWQRSADALLEILEKS